MNDKRCDIITVCILSRRTWVWSDLVPHEMCWTWQNLVCFKVLTRKLKPVIKLVYTADGAADEKILGNWAIENEAESVSFVYQCISVYI